MTIQDPDRIAKALFELAREVRYVAIYRDEELFTAQRDGLQGASAAESDRYEELLVNPTLLTLLRQRGNMDCGGLEYVLIRYGSFFALVLPLPNGHITVGLETTANAWAVVQSIVARADLRA